MIDIKYLWNFIGGLCELYGTKVEILGYETMSANDVKKQTMLFTKQVYFDIYNTLKSDPCELEVRSADEDGIHIVVYDRLYDSDEYLARVGYNYTYKGISDDAKVYEILLPVDRDMDLFFWEAFKKDVQELTFYFNYTDAGKVDYFQLLDCGDCFGVYTRYNHKIASLNKKDGKVILSSNITGYISAIEYTFNKVMVYIKKLGVTDVVYFNPDGIHSKFLKRTCYIFKKGKRSHILFA